MNFFLSVLWKSILLFLAALAGFAAGVGVPALRVSRVLSQSATNVRSYDFDWLIAVLLVWAALALAGLLRRRTRETVTATLALVVVASIVVLFTQLGVKDTAVQ